jgi:hypothetical protein
MYFLVLRRFLSHIMVLAAAAIVFSACNKEKPTKAVIIVKNQAGNVVSGVEVKLYANPSFPLGDPTRLNKEAITTSSGRAEFDYSDFYKQGQAGFAVLDILAVKGDFAGQGIIKILEEETNEETVILLPI